MINNLVQIFTEVNYDNQRLANSDLESIILICNKNNIVIKSILISRMNDSFCMIVIWFSLSNDKLKAQMFCNKNEAFFNCA